MKKGDDVADDEYDDVVSWCVTRPSDSDIVYLGCSSGLSKYTLLSPHMTGQIVGEGEGYGRSTQHI
jgi:hypothetical protein